MTDIVNQETAEQLRRYVEGIENYEAEKQEISERIKEIYDEAKSTGFDIKTIRTLVKIRKSDESKLEEEEYLLETYKEALGMASKEPEPVVGVATPTAQAAIAQAAINEAAAQVGANDTVEVVASEEVASEEVASEVVVSEVVVSEEVSDETAVG
jgi:uncharacterized protein (UPF0335 family)